MRLKLPGVAARGAARFLCGRDGLPPAANSLYLQEINSFLYKLCLKDIKHIKHSIRNILKTLYNMTNRVKVLKSSCFFFL